MEKKLACFRDQSDTVYIMVDGPIVRTHQHANSPKRDHDAQAIGRSQGGRSTKLHCLCDALGYPIAIVLSAGQRAECIQAQGLIDRCKKPFKYLLADTGYDSDAIRKDVRQRGGIAVIKPHPLRAIKPNFDKHIYKERHKIENLLAKLKHSRRLSTRYDKSSTSFPTFVCLATIKVCFMG